MGCTIVIVTPISLFRSMGPLRYTSFLGFLCCTYLGIILIVEYFSLCNNRSYPNENKSTCFWENNKFTLKQKDLIPSNFFKGLLQSWPLFCFAFTGQQSMLQ